MAQRVTLHTGESPGDHSPTSPGDLFQLWECEPRRPFVPMLEVQTGREMGHQCRDETPLGFSQTEGECGLFSNHSLCAIEL
jgi:hypothetical protein